MSFSRVANKVHAPAGAILCALMIAWTGATSTIASSSIPVDKHARASLPASIRAAGVLTVATSLQWAPFDYQAANGKPEGLDINLISDIAAVLGLTPQFSNIAFPSIVPAVSNGRYDVGIDELNDTAARRHIVQFVDYYISALGVLVRKGTKSISVRNLCGHSLALTQGSSQVAIAQDLSRKCVAAGKPAIRMSFFPDSGVTILAVANGRAQAFMSDKAVGVYTTKTEKNLTVLPGTIPGTNAYSGIVVAKHNYRLAVALKLALQDLMNDGRYIAILRKYGVPDAAIPKAMINAGAHV